MEQIRGCGYRKVGGAYLCGSGLSVPCMALPMDLGPCPTCKFTTGFHRGMKMLHAGFFYHKIDPDLGQCYTRDFCPICNKKLGDPVGVMWVSRANYTPESFINEATDMGISKRIAPNTLPKTFTIGQSWVLLAHREAITAVERMKPETKVKIPGVFYAFKPDRIEYLAWKSEDTPGFRAKVEAQGMTPVFIDRTPENEERHKGKAGLFFGIE